MKRTIVTVLSLLALSACHKHAVYTLNPLFRNASNFDTGSYLVYRDSITNSIDSFWVFRFSHGYEYTATDDKVETMYTDLKNSEDERIKFGATGNGTILTTHFQAHEKAQSFSVYSISDPFIPGGSISITDIDWKITNIEFLEDYTLNGEHYSKVYVVAGHTSASDIRYTTWFAQTAGLIKYEFVTDSGMQVMTLLRSVVIRK